MFQSGLKYKFHKNSELDYPWVGFLICLSLIYLSPFVSLALNYIAFVIFAYRIIRYEEQVFSVDYCSLAGVSYIFLSTGRVSLLAWLSIFAAVWFILKNGIIINRSLLVFVVLLDYMLLRMQTAFNVFILCFSQILLLYILISSQDYKRIPQCIKAFCDNIIFSSLYAFVFRNNYNIRLILGKEVIAYFGSSETRFQGLLRDPNYYMSLVVISISLILVLYFNHYISVRRCVFNCLILLFFGSITYSKTFIIVMIALVLIIIAMMLHKKKYFQTIIITGVLFTVALVMSKTFLSVTLYRITSATNMYDLTTGRSDLLLKYIAEISKSAITLFLGNGLSAEILRRGTHNIFLEIVFYFGLVGLCLMVLYVYMLISNVKETVINHNNANGLFKYGTLLIFILLFCTLQGITFAITYEMLYLTIISIVITPRFDENQSEVSENDAY